MKKNFLVAAVLLISLCFQSCTENSSVKNFGGTGTLKLTRPMKAGESPETYRFEEESSFGVMEGTYYIFETK